jgi:hypothetical protein
VRYRSACDAPRRPAWIAGRRSAALDEPELERRLYPATAAPIARKPRPLPHWTKIREELARRDHQVTLALLWTEYKAEHPDGYQYSHFVDLYRRFEKKLSVVLRQQHRAGEKVFVDFCDGIALIDPDTGELVPTQLSLARWARVPTRLPSPRCHKSCRCGWTVTCGCTSTWAASVP